jgi:hypothetical protein
LGYDWWIRNYKELAELPINVARFVATHDSAVLNVRNEKGDITTRVVQGNDPLKIYDGDVFIDIIGFGPGDTEKDSGPLNRFKIYARSYSGLGADVAQAIWNRFRRVNALRIDLHVYSDPWFLSVEGAPILDPFMSRVSPPAKGQERPYLTCFGPPSDAKPDCLNTVEKWF